LIVHESKQRRDDYCDAMVDNSRELVAKAFSERGGCRGLATV